jgi:hypothetical protein
MYNLFRRYIGRGLKILKQKVVYTLVRHLCLCQHVNARKSMVHIPARLAQGQIFSLSLLLLCSGANTCLNFFKCCLYN